MNSIPTLHMGALHPLEQALTLALAFGPFVVLGLVIAWRHRQDRQDRLEDGSQTSGDVAQRKR